MGRNWKPKYAQVCMSCDWTGKNTRRSAGVCPNCRKTTRPLYAVRDDLTAARTRTAELEGELQAANQHLDDAYDAVGLGRSSSEPLGSFIRRRLASLTSFSEEDVREATWRHNEETERWFIRTLNGNDRICRRDDNGRVKVMKVVGEGDGQMWFWELMPEAAIRAALTAFVRK